MVTLAGLLVERAHAEMVDSGGSPEIAFNFLRHWLVIDERGDDGELSTVQWGQRSMSFPVSGEP